MAGPKWKGESLPTINFRGENVSFRKGKCKEIAKFQHIYLHFCWYPYWSNLKGLVYVVVKKFFTPPPQFNSSPLKNDGWKTILSFWGPASFQGRTLKFPGCIPKHFGDLDSTGIESTRMNSWMGS